MTNVISFFGHPLRKNRYDKVYLRRLRSGQVIFGIHFVTFLSVILWLVLLLILLKVGHAGWLAGLKIRSVTLLGCLLILTAFFFQPWVQFNFLDYIFSTPQLLKDIFSDETIAWLAQLLGFNWLEKIVAIFSSMTNVTGLGLQLVPTLGGWTRFWLTAPPVFALLAAVWAPLGAYLRGSKLNRFSAVVVMGGAVVLLVGLAFSLPDLDALGIHDRFDLLLVTALLGAQLGNGPALTLLGLLLLLAGGVVEWQDHSGGFLAQTQTDLPEALL